MPFTQDEMSLVRYMYIAFIDSLIFKLETFELCCAINVVNFVRLGNSDDV